MADAALTDRRAKATGTYPFANDVSPAGVLHGAVVRSTVAHARLRGVDAAAARALDGVRLVLTAADVPGEVRVGVIAPDQRVLAEGRIRYAGEPVAFVVADTRELARHAATLVRVDAEALTAESDPAVAAGRDRPPSGADDEPGALLARHVVRRGDMAAARGVVAVDGDWTTGRQDPAFLAPEAATAEPWGDGVRLRVATQDVHADRDGVARVLGLPPELVDVVDAGVGGSFGGREELSVQPLVALAAVRLGRPVTCRLDSAESLLAHPARHPARAHVEATADADGRLRTLRARVTLDGGPYLTTSRSVARIVAYTIAGPYRFDAVDVEVRVGRTTNPTSGALRGFGATQACFALESTLDRLATRLGADPIELRLANAVGPGDRLPTSGQPLGAATPVAEVIRRARDHVAPALDPPPPGTRRGTALAVGLKHCLRGDGRLEQGWAALVLHPDGGVVVETAAVDVGQGVRTVIDRTVRRALGDVAVRIAPARSALGRSGSSSASRQTWLVTGAVHACCEAVLAHLRTAVGALEGTPIRLDRGSVAFGGVARPLADVLAAAPLGPVVRTYDAPATLAGDPEDGTGDAVHVAFMYSAHRATVDVEPDGAVSVRHVVAVHDCGTVVDEVSARRQVEGGVIQGIGFALYEDLAVDPDGRIAAAPGWAGYPVPMLSEVPPIDVEFVATNEPGHPLGVKGLGEAPLIASPTAVALAVARATSAPVTSIPLEPAARPAWLHAVTSLRTPVPGDDRAPGRTSRARPLRVGVIGAGAVGGVLATELAAGRVSGAVLSGVLRRRSPARRGHGSGPGGPGVCPDIDTLIARSDVVVEAAGHDALAAHGPAVVAAGRTLLVLSAGALADDALRAAVTGGPGVAHLVPGALGGLDALAALARAGGLDAVTLRTTKAGPALVRPWMDGPLADALRAGEPALAFAGTARAAAERFPQNANVAATLALATLGLDATLVEVHGGPAGRPTEHVVEASGPLGAVTVVLRHRPAAGNPRTSAVVPWSAVTLLERLAAGSADPDPTTAQEC